MAALTGDKALEYQEGKHYSRPIDGGATYNFYKGALVANDTSGYARPGANTAGFRFVGCALEKVQQTATASDGTNKVLTVRRGIGQFAIASAAVTDVGRPVWLTDDQTVSLTQTNVGPIGKIVERVSGTKVLVAFDADAGGVQFLSVVYGTSTFASNSTTVELSVGLGAVDCMLITNQKADAPTKVMSSDNTVSSGAVSVGRESSGTAEINFNYFGIGY